jgi:uncharacterized protein YhaN
MRITGLKVDGFGVWSELELSELSDQLSVFYGPNEAGKTTLMQFVRSVLYGFSPARRARYLPPLRGGRPGGTIQALAGQDACSISRHAEAGSEKGEATVTVGERDGVVDEHALAGLLGEVDEPTFNNVFAFGLREIQELGTLSDTQAAEELYSLALGLDRVSLIDVLNELEVSRNRLLASDDRPSLVTQLLGQRERLRDEIEDLSQATVRYLTLSAQRVSLDGEIDRLEADHARNDEQAREVALARTLKGSWQRRSAIDRQLEGLGSFDALPEGALARFERLGSRLAVRRRRFRRLARERKRLRGEIKRLAINEALCRQAPRLEALAEQQQWIRSLAGQVAKLEAEVLELEARRDDIQKQPGADTQSCSAPDGPLSKRDLVELRAAAASLRNARRAFRQLQSRSAGSEELAADFARQIDAAMGISPRKELTQALAEAGETVSQLRKRVQLDERLDQMSRRESQLDEQSHEHLENQILPTWALAGLGSLFVLGCALVLLYVAGLVLPASLSGALGWPVGLIGVMAAGAAGAIKFTMERSAVVQLDTCHAQIHSLNEQIAQARSERDELDQQLPKGGGPLVARLQTAEKSLARLEELLPLDAKREAAKREAAAAAEQAQTARGTYRDLRKQWRRLLAKRGLRADIRPSELRVHARRREQARGLTRMLGEKSGELTLRRAEYDSVATRIRQLIAEVGIAPRSDSPLEGLAQCLAELNEQQKLLKRRDQLARAGSRAGRRQRKLVRAANRLRRRRQLLMRAAETHDEQEFRRRADAQALTLGLRSERAELEREMSAVLGGTCAEERLAEWLAAGRDLAQLETELTETRRTARERLNAAAQRRGEMNEQLKTLVENRQLAHMRIELGIVEKRLQDAIDRWRVLAVCGMMLAAVREYYEREHQPQALREASLYLQRLTGGRYTRVWTPLGENSLRVDDRQAQSLSVEVLSRGTREQLFLALRLALVSSYARRGVALPLVLDDVLVNFDVGRAKAAALVLRDFARQGHQVLVFTCHEHISKLFRNIKADVRQLPDNAQPHAAPTEGSLAKRTRRARPEAPVEAAIEHDDAPQPDDLEVDEVFAESEPVLEPKSTVEPKPTVEPKEVADPDPARRSPPVAAPSPVLRGVPAEPYRRPQRNQWSAEEFDGELTDRVRSQRGTEWDREVHSDFDDGFAAGDDSEAAA